MFLLEKCRSFHLDFIFYNNGKVILLLFNLLSNFITKGSLQKLNCHSGDQLTVITGVIYFYLWYFKGLINGLRKLISHKTVIMNMSNPQAEFLQLHLKLSWVFFYPKTSILENFLAIFLECRKIRIF